MGDICLPEPQLIPANISSKEILSEDIIILRLRLPPTKIFKFIAGQYVDILSPTGIRRSYSLASTTDEHEIEFHVRKVNNGLMSDYVFNKAKVGDLLRIHGPHGTFVLRNTSKKRLAFLATGTGIAPVKSILGSLQKLDLMNRPKTITVYWGAREIKDFYIDLSTYKNLTYHLILSKETRSWNGRIGYVQDNMINDFQNLTDVVVYACGSSNMISDAKYNLALNGHPPEQFFSDAFVASS